jgi:hypothetical protein
VQPGYFSSCLKSHQEVRFCFQASHLFQTLNCTLPLQNDSLNVTRSQQCRCSVLSWEQCFCLPASWLYGLWRVVLRLAHNVWIRFRFNLLDWTGLCVCMC